MLDRFTQHIVDPLALMSNVSHQQYYLQSSTTLPSTSIQPHFADNTQLDLGLSPTDNLGRQNKDQGNNAWGAGAQNRVGNANSDQARQIKCYNCNSIGHIARNCTQRKRPQNSEYFKDKILLMQPQENGVALDEEQLLFITSGQDNVVDEDVDEQPVQDLALNVDNVLQADDYDVFDFDVDEAPTAQTMFMANLSSADPVYDEAGSSYDSDILSEVHDHDHYQDAVYEHHEVHEIHDDVQPNYVVDSHADYMSDSNMNTYDKYVKDNAVPVVQTTLREIIEDAKVEKPFDSSLASACRYTKHSQELVEYVIGTCPNNFNKGDKETASTPITRKKRVTFMNPCETSTHNNLIGSLIVKNSTLIDIADSSCKNIRVIPKYHSEDGNPARANIKQALGPEGESENIDLETCKFTGTGYVCSLGPRLPFQNANCYCKCCTSEENRSAGVSSAEGLRQPAVMPTVIHERVQE
nr:retrovirus-related Pol polyprotein from transposon TNT 1-94 [Tanacetum cinerariifolium]